MTQKQLADALEVSEVMISQYERGLRTPKIETIAKIAKVLKVAPGQLLANEDDSSDRRFQEVVEILEDCGFVVEIDKDDFEKYGTIMLNHDEANIAINENEHILSAIVESVASDAEKEKLERVKQRLVDIFGGSFDRKS